MVRFIKRMVFQYDQLVDAIFWDWVARQWFVIGLLVGIGLSWLALWSLIAASFLMIVILGIWFRIRIL